MDTQSIFVISGVVLIVVFVLLVLGTMALGSEKFQNLTPLLPLNPKQGTHQKSGIPGVGFRNATGFYNNLDDGLRGTSLVGVEEILTKRFPIAIETPVNWFSTQPLVDQETRLGTNMGKLPKKDCPCNP
jgi:hypothetical protein